VRTKYSAIKNSKSKAHNSFKKWGPASTSFFFVQRKFCETPPKDLGEVMKTNYVKGIAVQHNMPTLKCRCIKTDRTSTDTCPVFTCITEHFILDKLLITITMEHGHVCSC
jgi:hypothetical protein